MTTDTLAIRNVRRTLDTLLAHDWEGYAGLLADSYRLDDRRVGLKSSTDKAASVEMARVRVDLGLSAVDLDVVETRGERFALYHLTFHVSDFVVPVLAVLEIDNNGRGLLTVLFDEDDLDAARAELDSLSAT